MSYCRFFTLLLLTSSGLWADVRSLNGILNFDTNNDSQFEAVLNSTGLGLGTPSPSSNLHVMGNALVTGTLSVGGNSTTSSNLNVNGTMGFSLQTITLANTSGGNVNLGQNSLVLVDSSSGNINAVLPYAANVSGLNLTLKKTSLSNKVRVFGGGNSIDNYGILELGSNAMGSVGLTSNGSRWNLTQQYATIQEIGGDNLIGYWGFEETSGNTAHSYFSTIPGTMAAANLTSVSGKIGKAIYFDDTANTVLTMGNTYARPTKDFSVSAWIKPDDANNSFYLFSDYVWPGAIYGYAVYFESQYMWVRTANGAQITARNNRNVLVSGAWIHVVVICKSGTASVYFNGIAETMWSTAVRPDISYNSSCKLEVGGMTGENKYFKGVLDDFRLYNRALTPDETTRLYELGLRSR